MLVNYKELFQINFSLNSRRVGFLRFLFVMHFLRFPALKAIDYDAHPVLEHQGQNMETLKKGKVFHNFDSSGVLNYLESLRCFVKL